jgi:hypothetical protein
MAVTGGTWSVGSFGYNTTGYDYIGFVDPDYYQSERPARGRDVECDSVEAGRGVFQLRGSLPPSEQSTAKLIPGRAWL